MPRRVPAVLPVLPLLAVLLSGCFQPTGPIVGDWRGSQPAISYYYQRVTELILDGPPDANAGTYHLVTRTMQPFFADRQDNYRWTDTWQKRMRQTATGQPYLTLHLDHAPGTQDPDYIWTSNNLLVPLIDPSHPDISKDALRVALYPLPRTAYGYGRP